MARVLFPRVVCEKVLERESASERDADVKRARPSDHGDARASRPTRACSMARAGERAARASRRPDRSPETRAPRCRHAGCARRRQDSSSQRRSPRALRLRGRRARRRRGSRSPRAPRGVHRHGLRARAHTQDGPRRLRPRALRPGRLRPLPPPPAAIPTHSRSLRFFGRPISDSPSPPPLRSVGCGAPSGPTR